MTTAQTKSGVGGTRYFQPFKWPAGRRPPGPIKLTAEQEAKLSDKDRAARAWHRQQVADWRPPTPSTPSPGPGTDQLPAIITPVSALEYRNERIGAAELALEMYGFDCFLRKHRQARSGPPAEYRAPRTPSTPTRPMAGDRSGATHEHAAE